MSRINGAQSALPAVLICILILITLISCGRGGDAVLPTANPDLMSSPTEVEEDGREIPFGTGGPDLSLIVGGEFSTEAVNDLTDTLIMLRDAGGGVDNFGLPPGQFVVHVWDADTHDSLWVEAVIISGANPGSLWDIPGIALFENGVTPLTITVYLEGYAMTTIAGTTADVISIPLEETADYNEARVFGVAQNFGYNRMQFYTDTLVPDYTEAVPASLDGNYMNFDLSYEPHAQNGLSAFLFGSLGLDSGSTDIQVMGFPTFWMTNYFAWELGVMNPGDRLFLNIEFSPRVPPDGIVSGTVALPPDIWGDWEAETSGARLWAVPTAIFLDGERYLAVGPHCTLTGESPDALEYSSGWFDPEITEDRLVLSAQFVKPDGSADIVHADWHGVDIVDPIAFSGIPDLGVSDYKDGLGYTHPIFTFTDPMTGSSDLLKIRGYADGVGPVWNITSGGGPVTIDTANYDVPLTWLRDCLDFSDVRFRLECIDAISLDINGFTRDDVILRRYESAFSVWTDPVT